MFSRIYSMFDGLVSLITQASSLNFDTRKDAIDRISLLAQEDKIPLERIDEIFNIFILGVRDEESSICASSLSGIKHFIEKDKLCIGKSWQALDLSIIKATDSDNTVRKNSLLVIIELIKQNKLFTEKIVDALIATVQDTDKNISKSAIFGINRLIVNNKLPTDKLAVVWDLFIITANSEHAVIKKETLFGIGELIKKSLILAEKTEEVLTSLIESSKSAFSDIKKDALFSIGELVEKGTLPIGKIDEILDLLMIEAKSTYFVVRKEALFGVCCLIIKDALPADRIETVFELLVAGTRHLDDGSRREALFGISKLIEKNKLSADKIEQTVDIFVDGARDESAKQNSIFGIDCIVRQNKLPVTKIELVLSIFIKEANNINLIVRKNVISGINKIIVNNQLPLNKVGEIWDLFIATCHDDSIAIKKEIIFGITELIIKHNIPLERVEEILNLLVINAMNSHDSTIKDEIAFSISELIQRVQLSEKSAEQAFNFLLTQAKDNHNQIVGKIVYSIIKLMEKYSIPEEKIEELVDLLILGAKNVDIEIKNNSLYGLAKLIKDNRLEGERIEEVWALFLTGLRSADTDLKETALFGVGKLIENNSVSIEKLKKIINIFSLDKKYDGLREFLFLKIVTLIKNNVLSIEKIEQLLDLFIKNSEDVSINIRKEILKGIIELIDKNELNESRLHIVLNLLENRIKLESCQHTKHVAIVAIKKLADQNLIPEHKIEIILNLLISLKRSGALLFNGISEIEKEEIAEILNGITTAKINAAHPSITYLISGAESLTNEARAAALFQLTVLIRKENVPADRIVEVLAFLTAKAKDPYDDIRNNALLGINELIDKDILPIDTIEEMISLFIREAKNTNSDTRKHSLLGLNKLIEKSSLSVKKVEKIIDVLMTLAKDTDVSIKKHALLGINKLIEKNKLIKKIEKILDILIEESKNINADISQNALCGIIKLEEQDKVTSEKIDGVLNTLIFKATSVNADIKQVLIPCIVRLIERNKLSEEKIKEILELLIVNTDNARAITKKNALSGIVKLIVNYELSIEENKKILDLLIVKAKDTKIDIRQKAIFGISKLIEKNNLPLEKSEETLRSLIIMTKDSDSEIRSTALYGIRWLIEKKQLPENKIEELLDLLVSAINNQDVNVRNNIVSCLSQLIIGSNLLAKKIGKELDLLNEAELLEGSALYINELKGLIDSTVKSRIEGSEDKTTEILSFSSHTEVKSTIEPVAQILEQRHKIDWPNLEIADFSDFTQETLVEKDSNTEWSVVNSKDLRNHNFSKKKKAAALLPKENSKATVVLNKKTIAKHHHVIEVGLAKEKAPRINKDISGERSAIDEATLVMSQSIDEHSQKSIALPQVIKIKKDDIFDLKPSDAIEIAHSNQMHISLETVASTTISPAEEIEIKFGNFDDTSIIASDEATLAMSKSIDEHTREATAPPQAMKIKKDDISDLKLSDVIETDNSNQIHTSLEAISATIIPPVEKENEIKFNNFDDTSVIASSEPQVHRETINPSATYARKKHYYQPRNKNTYVPKHILIEEIQQLHANQQAMAGEIQRLNYALQNTAQQVYYPQFLDIYNAGYQSAIQQTFYQYPYVSNAVPQNIAQEIIQLQDNRGKIYYCIREQHLDTGQLNQFFINPETGEQVFPISYNLYKNENIGEWSENSGAIIQGTIEFDSSINRVGEKFDEMSLKSEYRSESFTVSQTLQLSTSSDSFALSIIDSSVLKSEFWRLSVLCNKNKAFVFLESKSEYRTIISTIHHDLTEDKSIATIEEPKNFAAEFIEEHYFSNVDGGLVQGTKRLSSGKISYEEKSNDNENALLISDGKSYQRTKIMFQSLGEALHSKLHLDQSFNAYVSDNEEVFHYILLDIPYAEANRLQQEWDTKQSERLVENSKSEAPTVSQILPSKVSTNLVNLSREIANAVLVKINILLNTENLMVKPSELEVELESELAKKLVTTNYILLELLEKNSALKLLFIDRLAAELNQNSQLYIEYEKFCIQEELKQNIGEFINSIIAQAKVGLEQHEYRDSSSGSIVEIRYVSDIRYDSDNLILRREELLYEAGQIGGIKAINDLIELGEDPETARTLIEAARQYGIKHVLNIIFSNQYAENAKLLKIETNIDVCLLLDKQNSVVLGLQFDPLTTSNNINEDETHQIPVDNTLKYFITQFLDRLNLDVSWQYKKFIYHQDLRQLKEILQNNNIDRSVDVLRDYSDFRKSVLLKLHPDKGGNNDDFIFVKALQEKFKANLDIKTLLDDKVQTISSMVHKASIGFKILDTIVDTVKLVYEPTIDHTKKLTLDSSYIYSMYSGVNKYSLGISAADILYQTYQGEYLQAFKQAAASMSYMALPSIIGYLAVPYLGFTYGTSMMIYTGYSSITSIYSFYQESGSVEFYLRSATAYKNFIQVLANSPLQKIYDFMVISKEYSVKVNKINLGLEKTIIKAQLEAKGEFGQKLYDYIYAPSIEEKYDLLNKVAEGSLTKEQAESLKTKHIKIASETQIYEHCMEIKNIINYENKGNETHQEYYYCYNDEQQILEYVVIGENRDIEIISRL